jgi:DDE superfamily endonuclease
VEPTTGEACWWAFPCLEAAGVTGFLQQLGQHSADRRNSVVLDQAPAHVAQRVERPENVVLVWLPASSPELHPVERLWEAVKRRSDVLKGQGPIEPDGCAGACGGPGATLLR